MTTTLASSVGDGRPSPLRPASTIVAAKSYHVLKVDGYSSTLRANPTWWFTSSLFSAGGHTWCIYYHPMGNGDISKDFISVFLVLEDTIAEAVMAQATFSLLDEHHKPVPFYTRTTTLFSFSMQDYLTRSVGYERFIRRDDLERSEHLKNDCFSIGVNVVIMKEASSTVDSVVPSSDMHLHYGNLLSSKRCTDIEFLVGGETFTAHRLVLAVRSPIFMAELLGLMKERTTINMIQIDGMEAQVFKALLNFIYTDTLPEMDQEDETIMARHLLIAADRYGLQRLKVICEERLSNSIDTSCVATILVLAEKHHCRGLKEVCFAFLDSPAVLGEIVQAEDFQYLTQNCPDILEDIISNIVARQLEKAIFDSENQGGEFNSVEIGIQLRENSSV